MCYSSNPSHPMPRSRGTGKGAKACFEVRERASPCPVWSSPQTTSSILVHTPANPWGPNSHVQDYPWSPGIPHGVHLRLSNPPRATRPRLQVPPTAMLDAPSPIRLHHSDWPILEQIAGYSRKAKNANSIMRTIKASFIDITPALSHKLYGAFIRPHLEYSFQAWRQWLNKDIKLLEDVQRLSTKLVKCLKDSEYEERVQLPNCNLIVL